MGGMSAAKRAGASAKILRKGANTGRSGLEVEDGGLLCYREIAERRHEQRATRSESIQKAFDHGFWTAFDKAERLQRRVDKQGAAPGDPERAQPFPDFTSRIVQ
jgi:hypothetical protein